MTVESEIEKLRIAKEQLKNHQQNIDNLKKKEVTRKEISLGRALLRKVKEKPEYREKILTLIEDHTTKEESSFLKKLSNNNRLF